LCSTLSCLPSAHIVKDWPSRKAWTDNKTGWNWNCAVLGIGDGLSTIVKKSHVWGTFSLFLLLWQPQFVGVNMDLNLCSLKGTPHLLKMHLFLLLRDTVFGYWHCAENVHWNWTKLFFWLSGFLQGSNGPLYYVGLGWQFSWWWVLLSEFSPTWSIPLFACTISCLEQMDSTSMTAGHQQFVTIHHKTSRLLRGVVKRLISLALDLLQSKEIMHVPPRSKSLNYGIEMQDLEVHSWAYGQQSQLHSRDCFCCHQ
jgi:hypothetical protein